MCQNPFDNLFEGVFGYSRSQREHHKQDIFGTVCEGIGFGHIVGEFDACV